MSAEGHSEINYDFELLKVEFASDAEGVLKVGINRPKKRNAFNIKLFEDYSVCMKNIKVDPRVRCAVVYGVGSLFSSGIDFKEIFDMSLSSDPARTALNRRDFLLGVQNSLSQAEACDKPIIMAVHNACIGLGLEVILAGDIRICTKDSKFSVKEIDFALAADVGALQRLPKKVSSNSWAREICFSGRTFDSEEALRFGLVSKVFPSLEEMLDGALKIASGIASKSPVAVLGTKHLLNYSQDHSISEGLNYTATWNGAMLQTEDIPISVTSQLNKTAPKYSKL